MPSGYERLRVSRYTGLDVNTAKIHMDEGAGRISRNFDFRRIGAARLRAGYARLMAAAGSGVVVVTASDDFNRADGALGANWTARGGTAMAIASNAARLGSATANAFGGAEYASGSFGADQFSQATLASTDGVSDQPMLVVRSSASGAYFLKFIPFGPILGRISSWTTPSFVTLGGTAYSWAAGDVMRLVVTGTLIEAYVNGALVVSVTDATISSGRPGIAMLNGASVSARSTWDDWSAGDTGTSVAFAGGPVQVSERPSRLFAFERDDDETRLIIANGTRLESFNETTPEWDE